MSFIEDLGILCNKLPLKYYGLFSFKIELELLERDHVTITIRVHGIGFRIMRSNYCDIIVGPTGHYF